MYVCMYIHMYVSMYVCMYVRMYGCTDVLYLLDETSDLLVAQPFSAVVIDSYQQV